MARMADIDVGAFDKGYQSGIAMQDRRRQRQIDDAVDRAARETVLEPTPAPMPMPAPTPMQQTPTPATDTSNVGGGAALRAATTPGYNPEAPSPGSPSPAVGFPAAASAPSPAMGRRTSAQLQGDFAGRLARSGAAGTGRLAIDAASKAAAGQEQYERAALEALGKGDMVGFQHYQRISGLQIPEGVLKDSRQARLYGQGMVAAEKLYRNDPKQGWNYVQAFIESGGDHLQALRAAGAPRRTTGIKDIKSFEGPNGSYAGYVDQEADTPTVQPVMGPNGQPARLTPPRPIGAGGGGGYFAPTVAIHPETKQPTMVQFSKTGGEPIWMGGNGQGLTPGARPTGPTPFQKNVEFIASQSGGDVQGAINLLSRRFDVKADPQYGGVFVTDRTSGEQTYVTSDQLQARQQVQAPAGGAGGAGATPAAPTAQAAPTIPGAPPREMPNPREAAGLGGKIKSGANVITGTFGFDPAFPETDQAQTELDNLSKNTMGLLQDQIPGRPTNWSLQTVLKMVPQPNDLGLPAPQMGQKLQAMRNILAEDLSYRQNYRQTARMQRAEQDKFDVRTGDLQKLIKLYDAMIITANGGRANSSGQPIQPGGSAPAAPAAPAAAAPAQQYPEGQTATGPNGEKIRFQGGQWVPVQ